jgi:hypothetical protein
VSSFSGNLRPAEKTSGSPRVPASVRVTPTSADVTSPIYRRAAVGAGLVGTGVPSATGAVAHRESPPCANNYSIKLHQQNSCCHLQVTAARTNFLICCINMT